MEMGKTSRDKDANILMRKLTLPDGFQVGIINLDYILREVARLSLTDDKAIKRELLNRIKEFNYVASSAENDYSSALFHEYQRMFDESGTTKNRNVSETRKHQPG